MSKLDKAIERAQDMLGERTPEELAAENRAERDRWLLVDEDNIPLLDKELRDKGLKKLLKIRIKNLGEAIETMEREKMRLENELERRRLGVE